MKFDIANLKTCKSCSNYVDNSCINTDEKIYSNSIKYGIYYAKECADYISENIVKSQKLELSNALNFLLAGNSEFIIESGVTGKKFHMKLEEKESSIYTTKDDNGNITSSKIYWLYTELPSGILDYAGIIYFDTQDNTYKFGRGSMGKLWQGDIKIKSILYILNNLYKQNHRINVMIYHLGKCGGCGNRLIDKQSIQLGLDYNCRHREGKTG